MTCTLPSKTIRGMSFSNGMLTVILPKYDRIYVCDVKTAYGLAYSPNPMAYYNENIKNKLIIIS